MKMKIVAISDTHGKDFLSLIPECDVFVHVGDIIPSLSHILSLQKEWVENEFLPLLNKIPAKYKIFVAGNHDFYFSYLHGTSQEDSFREKLPQNTFYLRDSLVEIDGVKFYGTPWVENLSDWAFNHLNKNVAEAIYSQIPEGLDFLLSHAPPYSYCDSVLEYNLTEKLGSIALLMAIIKKKPKYVLSGHIHSGEHNLVQVKTIFEDSPIDTKVRCVSLLNEEYKIHYDPFVFVYPKKN